MKLIRTLLFSLLVSGGFCAYADAPASYYSSLNGKKDAELKTAVYDIIHNFTSISSYSALPSYFQRTDVYPESKRWWDMYSDIPLYAPSFSGLNREHAFPKSWWGGTENKAYTDLNHLYPSEMKANTAKSNYPLGEVNTSSKPKFDNGVVKVGYPVNGQGGGAQYVFQPNDEYKGDFARTYFYMATCYQNLAWKYTYMVNSNTYPTLNGWSVDLLLKWHREDPVSQKEIDRNETVYSIQNNRNPFIDYPELAEYIWGMMKGEPFSPGQTPTEPAGDPELIAPVKDMTLDFGQVALGGTSKARLFVKGANLSSTVDVAIYSGDASMFKAATQSIPASQVNSEAGYWLEIEYTPGATGTHSSRLLVSGSFKGSVGVALRGECLPVPTLQACTATEPTDIQSDRYMANWTAPADDVIDYFVVTRTAYSGSEVKTEELVSENNSLEIDGFDASDRESYSVQSVRLGYRSPMSNVIWVEHSGISGVEVEQPLVVQTFPGIIRFICSEPQTNATVYDISGRLVMTIPVVAQDFEQEMQPGVYFIVTDQHRTPVKVYLR